MSDESSKNVRSKYRQPYNIPMDNPQVPDKKDWWNEMCKAAGEENYWPKDKEKSDIN